MKQSKKSSSDRWTLTGDATSQMQYLDQLWPEGGIRNRKDKALPCTKITVCWAMQGIFYDLKVLLHTKYTGTFGCLSLCVWLMVHSQPISDSQNTSPLFNYFFKFRHFQLLSTTAKRSDGVLQSKREVQVTVPYENAAPETKTDSVLGDLTKGLSVSTTKRVIQVHESFISTHREALVATTWGDMTPEGWDHDESYCTWKPDSRH